MDRQPERAEHDSWLFGGNLYRGTHEDNSAAWPHCTDRVLTEKCLQSIKVGGELPKLRV